MLEDLFGSNPNTKVLEYITEQALDNSGELTYEQIRLGARIQEKTKENMRGKALPDILVHFVEIGLLRCVNETAIPQERKYTINTTSMLFGYVLKTDAEYVKIVSRLAAEKKIKQMKAFETMRQQPKTKEGEQNG